MITAIVAMTGISRKHLHAIILGAPVIMSGAFGKRLTPLIRDSSAAGIAFRRHSPRDSLAPNGWE
jgi:hypothetical protein